MSLVNIIKGVFFIALLSFSLQAQIIDSADLLNQEVKNKLQDIGSELKQKTGFSLLLLTSNNQDLPLKEQILFYERNLTKPYAILALMPKIGDAKSGKVDIVASSDEFFDKDEILSPYPERGSIIPILVSNKGKDIYNAALLNGYADIAERVARKFNIELEKSIGNSNKNTLNLIRYLVYGSILFVIIVVIYRRIKK